MKFQFYYEKLINTDEFSKFKKDFPEAYFCSAFFALDREKSDNKVNFDFFLPEGPKMFSFKLDGKTEFLNVEKFDSRTPEKIDFNHEFDLEKIEEIVRKEMAKKDIKGRIQKLLFSLQKKDNQDYLLGTIFLSNMALLKIRIKIPQNEVVEFEKKSFFDMIKTVKGKNKDSEKK